MIIKSFLDKVLLPEKRDVLRVHLYLKFLQYGIPPYENDMNIVLELYCFGGYNNSLKQDEFFDLCLEKKYKKSKQSIRNTLSKYTNLGVFEKPRNTSLSVSSKYIPHIEFDRLLLQHTISHAN
jgi:hypothetical protein